MGIAFRISLPLNEIATEGWLWNVSFAQICVK